MCEIMNSEMVFCCQPASATNHREGIITRLIKIIHRVKHVIRCGKVKNWNHSPLSSRLLLHSPPFGPNWVLELLFFSRETRENAANLIETATAHPANYPCGISLALAVLATGNINRVCSIMQRKNTTTRCADYYPGRSPARPHVRALPPLLFARTNSTGFVTIRD